MLSGYCVETSCYNNVVANSSFNSDSCDSSYCEVTKTLVPTLPDINNNHWFFDCALYIGGVFHLWLSLVMVISYFLKNANNFVLPGFIDDFLKKFPTDSLCHKMYVKCLKSDLSLLCYIYRLLRLQLNEHCKYADEPLFGLRALYHIVRIT